MNRTVYITALSMTDKLKDFKESEMAVILSLYRKHPDEYSSLGGAKNFAITPRGSHVYSNAVRRLNEVGAVQKGYNSLWRLTSITRRTVDEAIKSVHGETGMGFNDVIWD